MKKILFLFSAVFFSTLLFAQTDFSGDWKLNTSKSKLGEQFSFAPKEVIIVQKGNDLSVETHSEFQGQEFTQTNKYTLDGKECVNAGFMDTEVKSTLSWSDDKKALKIVSKIPFQGETMTITNVYKKDGDNFIVEMKSSSSYGDMEETQVYDKK